MRFLLKYRVDGDSKPDAFNSYVESARQLGFDVVDHVDLPNKVEETIRKADITGHVSYFDDVEAVPPTTTMSLDVQKTGAITVSRSVESEGYSAPPHLGLHVLVRPPS